MIPAEQIAKVLRFVRCSGSDLWPMADSDGHGICQRCEQPFRLQNGVIPAHRIR